MATIKLRILVPELSNVMLQFDQIKVYRCATQNGTYAEITDIGTRIDLVVGTELYEYIDAAAPDDTYWYKTSYYNSATTAESSLSAPIQGSDVGGLYVSIQDVRDEGVDVTELSDSRALKLIYGWSRWFDRCTDNFFYPREMTIYLDGDGSRVMWLPWPIIEVQELYINDDFNNEVSSDDYAVYNRARPDDRKNPRIKLKRGSGSIYSSYTNSVFAVGDQNQKIVGIFGYVEEDYSVPYLVQRAIMTLVLATKELKGDSEVDQLTAGMRIEEVTDRHRVRFANLWSDIMAWKPTGMTEVDEAIRLYRRPAYIGMARSF